MKTGSAAAKGGGASVSSHYGCVLSGWDMRSGAIERRKFAVARQRSQAGVFGSSSKGLAQNCLGKKKERIQLRGCVSVFGAGKEGGGGYSPAAIG